MPIPGQPPASGIRDNHHRGTVGDFLRNELRAGADLDIVTAYFTVFAYDKLKANLDNLGRIRLLFGEAAFIKNIDPDHKNGAAYVLRDDGLALASGLNQRHIAQACAAWIRDKVEVRSVTRTGFLHGKMSHIRRGEVSRAIVGSSNFTTRGLGLANANNNVELNLVVDGDRDRADLHQWFNELWDDTSRVTDVKQAVLDFLLQVYRDQSPQFVYYKTLFELFRRYIDEGLEIDENLRRIRFPDTQIWQALYTFQRDGARSAINKIKRYNGCILADSVGLGKTYTALAVIKYFELRNEKVLVLCPKKLRRNWTIYRPSNVLCPFPKDRFGYHVLSHTDLGRETGEVDGHELANFNWGAYDLVVIDESHNFRNNKLATQRPGEPEKRTRYQRLMEDIISSGARTKVLLLSATPVNNQLADLRNQISFIAGGDVARDYLADSAFAENLDIASVKETTRLAQTHFTRWSDPKRPPELRKTRDLIAAIGGDFFKLLDGLSLARSRRQIASYYSKEMASLGGFPKRPPPKALNAPIDLKNGFLSFEQLDTEISALRLALYHPTSFLRDDLPAEVKAGYERKILGGFTQEGREKILISMMKVNFLKRLESSVDSFRLTLERTIAKIDTLEKRITAFEQHLDNNPDLDFDSLTPDQFEDPDFDGEDFTIGGRRRLHLGHPSRRAVFVGDLIDRGPDSPGVVRLVRGMVESGAAYMVAGNHEFNAVGLATADEAGNWLRPRTADKIGPHQTTLNQVAALPEEWADHLAWFRSLPVALDFGGLRVVHAAWHGLSIEALRPLTPWSIDSLRFNYRDPASTAARELVLNGPEIELPEGGHFFDHSGKRRTAIRTAWWTMRREPTWSGLIFPPGDRIHGLDTAASTTPPPPLYGPDEPPVIFGHYALPKDASAVQAANIACVDFGAGKGGALGAYRWDGERELSETKVTRVTHDPDDVA